MEDTQFNNYQNFETNFILILLIVQSKDHINNQMQDAENLLNPTDFRPMQENISNATSFYHNNEMHSRQKQSSEY